jgi:hypothetical protein
MNRRAFLAALAAACGWRPTRGLVLRYVRAYDPARGEHRSLVTVRPIAFTPWRTVSFEWSAADLQRDYNRRMSEHVAREACLGEARSPNALRRVLRRRQY